MSKISFPVLRERCGTQDDAAVYNALPAISFSKPTLREMFKKLARIEVEVGQTISG